MKEREVQDDANVRWTCVQAFAGVSGATAEEAVGRSETADGRVTVVCTPDGGAQTVRLQLAANWLESCSDAQLLGAIHAGRSPT